MARAIVLLAEGFEEIETATVVDVLRRGEVEVVLAGIAGPQAVRGSRGMVFAPDVGLAAAHGPWDLVALPGGAGGARRLADDEAVLALVRAQVAAGGLVGAVCAAPLALDAAGVLTDGAFTCYPGVESGFRATGRRGEPVVDAGAVVTSQGAGTALAWALHLVERLRGGEVRRSVAERMIAVG